MLTKAYTTTHLFYMRVLFNYLWLKNSLITHLMLDQCTHLFNYLCTHPHLMLEAWLKNSLITYRDRNIFDSINKGDIIQHILNIKVYR